MIAALFPGQGSQYIGMGHDLYLNFPAMNFFFQEAEDMLGCHLKKTIFDGTPEELSQTALAQPAIFVVSMSILSILEAEFGLSRNRFAYVAGHSLGECSALCAAGVLSFSDMLLLIKARYEAMGKISGGAMAAIIGGPRAMIQHILDGMPVNGICEVVNDNSPLQVVLSGQSQTVDACVTSLAEKTNLRTVKLNVSGPFHSSLMKPAQEEFEHFLSTVSFDQPHMAVVTNISACAQSQASILKKHLGAQMASPVLWTSTQQYLAEKGVRILLEIGPGKVLTGLGKKTIPEHSFFSVGSMDTLKSLSDFIALPNKMAM